MQKSQKMKVSTCLVCNNKQLFNFAYRGYQYFKCTSCGLVTTYPYPDHLEIEAHYAKKFDNGNYSLLRTFSKEYLLVYNKFAEIIEQKLKFSQKEVGGIKILDIGCFTGDFLEILNEKGADVYGLELQDRAVEIANMKLPGRVYKADVMSNDFPALEFDVVSLFGLIEHVVDPIKLLKRSSELLKKDGLIILQTPDSNSFMAKIMGKYWPPYAPIEHIHLFTRKSLELKLHELGFKNISIIPHYKKLPIKYVFNMLQNFGPEFYRLFKPIFSIIPQSISQKGITFYIGEIIVTAQKI